MFILIWVLNTIRINLHFLNPFNETIRDYEITDIVYSRLRDKKINTDERIVLVNTGLPSRDTLRMVIDRIVDAEARVIALDVMLEERKSYQTDSMLRASMLRAQNMVLAMEIDGLNEETNVFSVQKSCDTFFCDYVYSGFVNLVTNDTSTIRIFSPREMTAQGQCLAFPVQVARLYDEPAVERLFARNNKVEEIFYSGNEDQFVQYEISDILDSTNELRSRLKDKIVLIGFLPLDAWDKPLLDRHYTPLNARYTGRNTPDMYGVVIHANIIRMILDGTYIKVPNFWFNLLLTFLVCYFNIHLFYQIFRRVSLTYHFITRFLQLGEILILFFIVALLFHFYRIKLEAGYWITALLLTFDVVRFYDTGLRRRIPMLSRLPDTLPIPKKKAKPVPEKTDENETSATISGEETTDSKPPPSP